MTARDLLRPLHSLRRIRFRVSDLPPGQLDRLKLILSEGAPRRCATNIVVYGGRSIAADEFAAAVRESMQTGDSLWRVGDGHESAGDATWLDRHHTLLSMLNADVVFIPADSEHQHLFEMWRNRAAAIFVGPGLLQKPFAGFADHMLRWDSLAERQAAAHLRSGSLHPTHGSGIPFPASAPVVLTAHARSAPLDAGSAFFGFRSDYWSKDHKIHAIVAGADSGDLSVNFETTDPGLLLATIRFRFWTTGGKALFGEVQLLRDDRDETGLAAIWTGNQMDLRTHTSVEPAKPGESEQLMFDFEVLPKPPG